MSKLTIIGVIVLMSISLLGVVGLQLYWISDAVRVKQEQFDRSVHEALAKVVEKLETQEAVSAVASGMATLQDSDADVLPAAGFIPAAPPIPLTPTFYPPVAGTSAVAEPKRSIPQTASTAKVSIARQKAKPDIGGNYVHINFASRDSAIWAKAYTEAAISLPAASLAQLERLNNMHAFTYRDSSRTLQLHAGNAVRIERINDSVRTYVRQANGKSIRISVDTLQYIALHMDSIWRQQRPNSKLKPEEIAALNLLRDSVFVLKKSSAGDYQMQRAAHPKLSATTPHQSVRPPHGGLTLTDKPGKARHITREKQLFTHTIVSVPNMARGLSLNPPSPLAIPETPTQPDPAKLEAKKEKLNDVVEKMVVEYVSKEVPLQERLSLTDLKGMLQAELQSKGIALDFGYWVLSGKQDTVVASHIADTAADAFTTYKASLFPNDIFDKPDYLAVYFPDSQAYALKSLWVMLLFSAIFTLVIMATFGTTIHIIFKQKKLSEMKNDFINNMTHEFKTPIATISLATDSIANPKIYSNPEKIKYYTNIIRQENKRMNVQVENVLQIAQLEKNDYRMNLQPVDLHALIEKAIDSIRLQVEERLGQITTQLCAFEHELKLDEVHVYNIICNLLDNANKYSTESPDIVLMTQNVEGGVLLAVEDKGVGMTRDTQLRVFDKFYRVPTGNLHNIKGFGLGLSYVKAIVKAHNGHIRLQSEPGKGSRFEIFLPFTV
ncbi:HAMP domain-containing histidine kinase [Pontibacter sp. JH31]|uniref:histidine kinase n=1 Tax=Pontibacter aquaedesilientis TaxID=2766980 RepID=A0ABR7XBA9_9BACT|nr:HAMP domain-containing sensor histidine kinase [Pontibacter aquaedesilientis]MBD1395597.1 HAMP domain-containing histidine kinase [Pontibacter aquaedesilientis]